MNTLIDNTTRTHIPRFSRSNGATNYTSRSGPIDPGQLRAIAPSIYAPAPHDSRSDKYAYIPTGTILDSLAREGFRPYSVNQGGSRDETKRGFTKHLLRLRHDSQELQVGGTHHEIVLLNSHDGTSSYRLMAGVFRLVCQNGLVIAEDMLEDIRIPHKGDVAGQVLDGCITMLDRLPQVSDTIADMSSLALSQPEREIFARAAITARYGDDPSPIRPEQVITARRSSDVRDSSVWTTFNVIQENLIRGGLSYVQRDDQGRRVATRHTREIRGVDQNTNLNRALWTLAEEMRALKNAG
jgi:hypothetical protein